MTKFVSPNTAVLVLALVLAPIPCLAEDGSEEEYFGSVTVGVGGLGGTVRKSPEPWAGGTWAAGIHTVAYSVGYRQQLRDGISGSLTYVNQGHYDDSRLSNHHSRDDLQAEMLMGRRPAGGPVEFHIGGGLAYYSETDRTGPGLHDFQNKQGFGVVVSGIVDFDISKRLFLEGRVHRHLVWRRYPSTNVLFGLGLRLQSMDRPESTGPVTPEAHPNGEVLAHSFRVSYGYGILNSTHSEPLHNAFQLGYSREISKHFAVSASFLNEGKAPELDRKGVALQGELKHAVSGPFSLGIGLGPYLNVDKSRFFFREGGASLDALLTVFLDIRMSRNMTLSVSANRPRSITTLKNRPMTDVFQYGLKYRF